jgi:predicted nucleic acid-binding protein
MATSVYFDASLLVSLFVVDRFADRARVFVQDHGPIPVVSDFAAAEFASAISRLVRTNQLGGRQATPLFSAFDGWRAQSTVDCWVETSDVAAASTILRRLDSPLRAPDALHLAMTRRLGAALATFDERLAEIASANGVEIAAL